jgi:FkbM family methyltransferase
MQRFGSSGALRFLRASTSEKRLMINDVAVQFRRDRRLRHWSSLVRSGERFTITDGPERYLLPVTEDDLGSQIFIYGEAEFTKVHVTLDLLHRTHLDRFIDVGANVGQVIIPGLARGLFRTGVAIEPDPTNFGCLAVNAVMNDVTDRLRLVHAAAGNGSVDLLQLAIAPSEFGDHRVAVDPDLTRTRRIVEIPATTIDGVAPGLSPDTDLIWMDIQGYEVTALRGASQARASRVPIVMEFWPEGILSAGESLGDLVQLTSAYDEVADLSQPENGFAPIEQLGQLWAVLRDGSRGRAYVDILLR